MTQRERMNSASNRWEADPWNASDEVADVQLKGFGERAAKRIAWKSIRTSGVSVFDVAIDKLIGDDVEYYATHDGEDMLLMQLAWHGFPDPPEWRLATRRRGEHSWSSWGYFDDLPPGWILPHTQT